MGRLILVRHGETEKNNGNKLHGTDDPESLNASGVSQIEQLASSLAKSPITKIYSSKEKRALESAKILSKILKVPAEPIDGMQERNWGMFTDKPWANVKVILDPMSLEERYTYVPPRGESWKKFEARLIGTIKKVTEENKEGVVVVVAHGGAIRALMPFFLNVPKEESFKYDPRNASITIFDFDERGFREVIVDDISHLEK